MDAHGVHVLDGADNHHVVRLVPHDLEFVFLPPEDGFLDEDFIDGRRPQPAGRDLLELVDVEGESPAAAAQGVGRANADRQTEAAENLPRLLHVVSDAAGGHVQANPQTDALELGAVLSAVDDFPRGADHLHAVVFQHPRIGDFDGHVQPGLTAQRR
jgi:hypothetical protein